MKKVVVVSGSPRMNGNCEILCREFIRGAQEAGNWVDFIPLSQHRIDYCIGCCKCTETGNCFQSDAMNGFNQLLLQADVIVLATPVYFYSMTAQMKAFIDRMMPVYQKIRADIYLMVTAWDDNCIHIESTVVALRGLTRDCLEDCPEKGLLVATDILEKGAVMDHPEYLKWAYKMGLGC